LEFLLLGGVILVLGLAGVRPGRRSYTVAGLAGLLAAALIYLKP
jgi:hypothetical protein